MDHRTPLLQQLQQYKPVDSSELQSRDVVLEFVRNYPRCFENDCLPGHITGSALVVDHNKTYALLNHHRKHGLWIQFGGHSDGIPDPIITAIRESKEESGLSTLAQISGLEGIFDIDVHQIPANTKMPAHIHYDIRILLVADRNEPVMKSAESHDLKWVRLEDIRRYNTEQAFSRMIRKVIVLRDTGLSGYLMNFRTST